MPQAQKPESASEKRLVRLQPRPTELSSRAIGSEWDERIKQQALFSARTTSRAYLDMVKRTLADVASRRVIPSVAEAKLQGVLHQLGYTPQTGFGDGRTPPATPGSTTDLSSSRRIQLIIDTNVKQARSMGQMAVGEEDPDVLMALPAWKLTRTGARKKPRGDWAARWKAAGESVGWAGALKRRMVALKNSPIWQAVGDGVGGYDDALGSPYPPFAFGSGMAWVNVDGCEWKAMCKQEGKPDGLEDFGREVAAKAKASGKKMLRDEYTEEEKAKLRELKKRLYGDGDRRDFEPGTQTPYKLQPEPEVSSEGRASAEAPTAETPPEETTAIPTEAAAFAPDLSSKTEALSKIGEARASVDASAEAADGLVRKAEADAKTAESLAKGIEDAEVEAALGRMRGALEALREGAKTVRGEAERLVGYAQAVDKAENPQDENAQGRFDGKMKLMVMAAESVARRAAKEAEDAKAMADAFGEAEKDSRLAIEVFADNEIADLADEVDDALKAAFADPAAKARKLLDEAKARWEGATADDTVAEEAVARLESAEKSAKLSRVIFKTSVDTGSVDACRKLAESSKRRAVAVAESAAAAARAIREWELAAKADAKSAWKPVTDLEKKTATAMSVIGAKHSKEDLPMEKTNPNYSKPNQGARFHSNCQRCVGADEARARGWKVEALPCEVNPNGTAKNADVIWRGLKYGTKRYMFPLYKEPDKAMPWKSRQDIVDKMAEWGDGARCEIGISWRDGGAHAFRARQENGKTVFYDPQDGKEPYEPWDRATKKGRVAQVFNLFLRTDDQEFSDRIRLACSAVPDAESASDGTETESDVSGS